MTLDAGFHILLEGLKKVYSENESAIIADWVMEHFTGKTKAERSRMSMQILPANQQEDLTRALLELLEHRPVQYVLGETIFAGHRILVNESVLIPRPETEELVADALEYLDHSGKANPGNPVKILDIGTGSGCIAIAIKKALPHAQILGIDLMENALETARQNGTINGVNIQWQALDFLDESNWEKLGNFDLILSNPPYITLSEKAELDSNVVEWEPKQALFVPDKDPLLFYRKIADFAQAHLQSNGRIFLECHQKHAEDGSSLFRNMGYKVLLKKDLFGNDRFLQIKKA